LGKACWILPCRKKNWKRLDLDLETIEKEKKNHGFRYEILTNVTFSVVLMMLYVVGCLLCFFDVMRVGEKKYK
jgi:hypothetical protein